MTLWSFQNIVMEFKVLLAVTMIYIGCCTNVVFLELLINYDRGSGNIITFVQFLIIAVEGLIFQSRFFTVAPVVPIKRYVYMVLMFFSVSLINNYALNFNVPLPLHMIFRSGSLISNMILGKLILHKKYSIVKYIAVVMVTIGITLATLASANNNKPMEEKEDIVIEVEDDEIMEDQNLMWLCVGIFMLTVALLTSSALGLYQEFTYKQYGKYPKEAMFYCHALPLPWFLFVAPDLINRISIFNQSDVINIHYFVVPVMFIYLLMNGITQYLCIYGVFILTTECSSLVVTFVITLRKFVSLLFSIWYFQNSFTVQHWIGTLLVFSGTAIFADILQPIASTIFTKPTKQD